MEFKFHWIQILLNMYWEYAHDYGVEKKIETENFEMTYHSENIRTLTILITFRAAWKF
jgi:hypothetical protein